MLSREYRRVIAALIDEEQPVAIVAHSFGSAATTVALAQDTGFRPLTEWREAFETMHSGKIVKAV